MGLSKLNCAMAHQDNILEIETRIIFKKLAKLITIVQNKKN